MSIEKNKYYQLKLIGVEGIAAAEKIIKQYPLTRVFLNILGRYFLDKLQFGIFTPGHKIIQQGDRGNDLFLICSHSIDVTVNGSMIVQMTAPALIGDKGIVDKNSTRNATITISEGQDCLLLRLPMGLFIRSFKKKDIKDIEYNQEKQLYHHLFHEIQERLFKYVDVQKSLWEEISARINSLNNQLVAGIISRKEEKGWGQNVWEIAADYLQSTFQFSWPGETPANIYTISERLKILLESRFPRSRFKGSDQSYTFKKQATLKSWMNDLSDVVIKALPSDVLPISVSEIELFNPRVYQMRVNRLMRAIEKNLRAKHIKTRTPEGMRVTLNVRRFFDRDPIKGFDLETYLSVIDKLYKLKGPHRVLAQIAQQVAQLGALCENEFNVSVSRMRYFLEQLKKISVIKDDQVKRELQTKPVSKFMVELEKGFTEFNKRAIGQTDMQRGELRYLKSEHPSLSELIESCKAQHTKTSVEHACQQLLNALDLKVKGFSQDSMQQLFHVCELGQEDFVPSKELSKHHWFPVSAGLVLNKEATSFSGLQQGNIVGGHIWSAETSEGSAKKEDWILTSTKSNSTQKRKLKEMVFIIPSYKLPWMENTSPKYDAYDQTYLPLLQWMVNRYLDQIHRLEGIRNIVIDRYSKVSEVVVTERKVREFEGRGKPLSDEQQQNIIDLVIDEIGIKLERKPKTTTEQLSKQLYNAVLEQTKKDFPKLTIEEQGNKAYTLWRFVQSEIVNNLYLKATLDQIRRETPPSAIEAILGELEKPLKEASIKLDHASIQLASSQPSIDLKQLLLSNKNLLTPQRLRIGLTILETLENLFHQFIDETTDYQKRLKQIASVNTEFDVTDIQTKFIKESALKLYQIAQKHLNR